MLNYKLWQEVAEAAVMTLIIYAAAVSGFGVIVTFAVCVSKAMINGVDW